MQHSGLVARIHVHFRQGRRRVTIRGRLVAADLKRLEQACGPALEEREMSLDVCVRDASTIDEPARLFLNSLVKRGAVVT